MSLGGPMKDQLRRLIQALSQGLYERHETVRLSLLALLAGESVFFYGPPGTAKSLLARRLRSALEGARGFEYLMGRFSTPDELFGPLSLKSLRDEDRLERRTEGYLPDADFVFLDEVWRASAPIQNALLTVLNERIYRNGAVERPIRLKALVAASNSLPAGEEAAEAFWDRFLMRLEVKPLQDPEAFRAFLADDRDPWQFQLEPGLALTETQFLNFQAQRAQVKVPEAILALLGAWRSKLPQGAAGLSVSDRRWKKAVHLLQACAAAQDRSVVDPLDVFVLVPVLGNNPAQEAWVRDSLIQILADFGVQPPFDLAEVQAGFEGLHRALIQLTRQEVRVQRREPLLANQEYYTVLEFRPSVVTRIWAEEWSDLADGREREGEVYFFATGYSYALSERHRLQRGPREATLRIDGTVYELESREVEAAETHDREPEAAPLAAWETEARRYLGQLEAWTTELEAFRIHRLAASRDHLFVDPRWAEVPLGPLDQAAHRLTDLRLRTQRLISLKRPEP